MRHLLPVLLLVGACKKDPTEPSTTDSADPTGTGDTGDTGTTAASTVRWLNIGGGLGEDEWVTSIAVAPGGPVAAVAQTQSVATWWTGTDDEVRVTADGDIDGVLLLVNPDTGALENLVHIGGAGTVVAEAVAASSDRLAVVFAYDGETTLDGAELAPPGAKGRLLMLFDHEGGLQWSRRIDSDFIVGFWGQVAFDASGGLLLGLSTIGDVVVDPGGQALLATGAGATDSTVARFDLDGTADWVRLVGNGSDQYSSATLAMPDGGYVLTGGFANTLTVGTKAPVSVTAPVGGDDVYVARFDASGEPVWVTAFGSTSSDAGEDLVLASDGAIWTAGQFAYGAGADLMVDGELALEGRGFSKDADGYAARLDPDSGEVEVVVGLITTQSEIPWLLAGTDGQVLLHGQILPAFEPGDPVGTWSDGEPVSAEGRSSFYALLDADGTFLSRWVGSYSALHAAGWADDDLVLGGFFETGASFGVEGVAPVSEGGSLDALVMRVGL